MVLYPRRHPHRMNYGRNSNEKSEEEKKCVHFILFFSLSSLVCKKGQKKRERASLKCRFSHDRTGKFNFPKWCWICSLSRNWKKKVNFFFFLLLPSPPFKQLLCVEIVEVIPTRETAPGSLIIQFKSVAILPKREMCSAIKIQLSVMIFDSKILK